jgi:hypothetical protein
MKIIELPSQYCERTAGASKSNFGRLLFQYSAMVLKLALRGLGKKVEGATRKPEPALAERFAR